jgi:hypothetical protein
METPTVRSSSSSSSSEALAGGDGGGDGSAAKHGQNRVDDVVSAQMPVIAVVGASEATRYRGHVGNQIIVEIVVRPAADTG